MSVNSTLVSLVQHGELAQSYLSYAMLVVGGFLVHKIANMFSGKENTTIEKAATLYALVMKNKDRERLIEQLDKAKAFHLELRTESMCECGPKEQAAIQKSMLVIATKITELQRKLTETDREIATLTNLENRPATEQGNNSLVQATLQTLQQSSQREVSPSHTIDGVDVNQLAAQYQAQIAPSEKFLTSGIQEAKRRIEADLARLVQNNKISEDVKQAVSRKLFPSS